LPARQQDKVEEWIRAGFNPHDYASFGAMAEAVIAWIYETLEICQVGKI
jgi:hypothetical protein